MVIMDDAKSYNFEESDLDYSETTSVNVRGSGMLPMNNGPYGFAGDSDIMVMD